MLEIRAKQLEAFSEIQKEKYFKLVLEILEEDELLTETSQSEKFELLKTWTNTAVKYGIKDEMSVYRFICFQIDISEEGIAFDAEWIQEILNSEVLNGEEKVEDLEDKFWFDTNIQHA